MNYHSN